MIQDKKMLEQLKSIGVPEQWYVLSEISQDSSFDNLLTDQERNILTTIKGNIGAVNGFKEYVVNIVSKYYGWQLQKDSKLIALKSRVTDISDQLEQSQKDLDSLTKFSKVAGGAMALTAYSKIFEDRSGTHANNAKNNFRYYLISLAILLLVIGSIFFLNVSEYNFIQKKLANDLQMIKFSIGVYALKAVVLVFFFQITQFFRKNYNAEKHLQQVNLHRSDVLQSLHAVYVSIDNQEEKDKILSTGALFAFERGETGYITTKEGAGSGDGSIESIFSKLLK